jgi:hypothetical protein
MELALLSPQMVRESAVVDFDFVSAPYTKILVVREDGLVAVLLYDRTTGTASWYRIRIATGKVISCATAPGITGYDDIFFAVKTPSGAVQMEKLIEGPGKYTDGHTLTDGLTYSATFRSMPMVTDGKDGKKRIANIGIRFLNSALPKIIMMPENRIETITHKENLNENKIVAGLFSGVYKTSVQGGYDRDVQFELTHDEAKACMILAIDAEVQ